MSILGLFCGRGEICRLSAGARREGHRRREGWITLQSDCVLLLLFFFYVASGSLRFHCPRSVHGTSDAPKSTGLSHVARGQVEGHQIRRSAVGVGCLRQRSSAKPCASLLSVSQVKCTGDRTCLLRACVQAA